jgi:hypothetical protein
MTRISQHPHWQLAPTLLAAAALVACGKDEPTANVVIDTATAAADVPAASDAALPDASSATCPPAPVPAGQVRARTLGCTADVPQGAMAAGRIGDIVLENARARFVLRTGKEGHAMVGLLGGNLVDAVALGPDGKQTGADSLREWVPLVAFHLVQPDAIEVVAAGPQEARVRVKGKIRPFPLVEDVLPLDTPPAEVWHEYTLKPDTAAIEVRTVVQPTAQEALDAIVIGDITLWSGNVALYAPGSGKGTPPSGSKPTLMGLQPVHADEATTPCAVGSDEPLGTLNIGAIQAFLQPDKPVPASGRVVVRRLAVAADGQRDLAAAMAAATGQSADMGTLQGKVAGMWPGVEIEVQNSKGGPLTRCRPDAGGAFQCLVPVATAAVRAVWLGNGNGEAGGEGQGAAATKVEVQAGATLNVDVAAPKPARLVADVRDAGGQPVPFRMAAISQDGSLGERTWYDPDGAATLLLPAGTWDIWLHHGPEWSEHHETVTLKAGADHPLKVTLTHVVDTDGWIAADLHVHAEHSSDSTVPNQHRLRNAIAEGLDYGIATDHDFVTDYSPWLKAAGLQDKLTVASGVEVSTIKLGHFNTWPVAPDANRSGNGAVAWFGKNADALLAEIRANDQQRVVQSNHPRGAQGYFNEIGLDAKTDAKLLAFDTVELVNAKRYDDTPQVINDWLGLHSRGFRITGTGASDTHSLSSGIGTTRTYVWLGKDASGKWLDRQGSFTAAQADQALKKGRAIATTGPMLVLSVLATGGATGDAQSAGIGETLQPKAGQAITVRAVVQAPAWLPLGSIVLYRNGKQVHSADVAGTALAAGKRQAVVELPDPAPPTDPPQDAWWVAVHKPGAQSASPGQHRPVWAVTNPVFVDVK